MISASEEKEGSDSLTSFTCPEGLHKRWGDLRVPHRAVSWTQTCQLEQEQTSAFLLNLKVSSFLPNFSDLSLEPWFQPILNRFGTSCGANGFTFSWGSFVCAGAGDVCEPLWGEVPQRGGQVPLPERAHQSAVPKGERAQGLAFSVPLTVGVTKTLQVKSSVLPRLRPLQTPIMSLGDPQATCTSARPATSSEVPLTPSARLPNSLDRKIHRTQKSTILNNILLF